MLEKGTIVLTDKGFGITELCLAKGLHHNRPPLKYNPQYDETEISKNFDIATLRIYNVFTCFDVGFSEKLFELF